MKWFVCIKQVADVTVPLRVQDGKLTFDAGRMVMNAYDASALEEALVLTEKHGGEVEVVLVGPESAGETVRQALAMGASRATHLLMEEGVLLDSAACSALLASFFEDRTYDVIACGKQSQDTDAGLTGSMLAERLGLPYVSNAVALSLEPDARALVAIRQADTGREVIELSLPCLVTCSNDMNTPRIPNLKGIMAAKRKPVDVLRREPSGDHRPVRRTIVVGYEPLPQRELGRILEGSAEEQVQALSALIASQLNGS